MSSDTSQDQPSAVLRATTRRALPYWPVQKIADDGFAVGLGGIGLVKGDAELTMVVQDQVDGDIVEGLGLVKAHSAQLTLNSTLAHLSPCRGIVTSLRRAWQAILPGHVRRNFYCGCGTSVCCFAQTPERS
jgi:hypothetical protein